MSSIGVIELLILAGIGVLVLAGLVGIFLIVRAAVRSRNRESRDMK